MAGSMRILGPAFDELVGKHLIYHGAAGHQFRVADAVYEAIEDENDGYRSMLQDVAPRPPEDWDSILTRDNPLAEVVIVRSTADDFDGYELQDVRDGFVWLTIGTSNTNDYYPYFTFQPQTRSPEKAPKLVKTRKKVIPERPGKAQVERQRKVEEALAKKKANPNWGTW